MRNSGYNVRVEWIQENVLFYFYLKGKGIGQKDILYVAETDVNPEGDFADGYLVLTGKGLGIFLSSASEER